ncbi:response regulator [Dyadobacter psychrotolerans]|uniref:Response regulator n=1 Tax=Dyadobacter psychrotolerans TaxID=2541721 RepID=A0A4R5DRL1_9BACT|nr:response regulator [Dyadobacter psychrotolerans]TDE14870.1 response regulator [Dyadobacter psychrotolerans]
MKICIIDDDWVCRFINQKLIGKILEEPNVLQFEDGQDAFDFFEQWQHTPGNLPDVILLDINMPRMDGWQFIEMFRNLKNHHYNPFIYISSSSQHPDDMARATAYPEINGYLPKPLSIEVLKKVLSDVSGAESSSSLQERYKVGWQNRQHAHA